MKKFSLNLLLIVSVIFQSCSTDDDGVNDVNQVTAPNTYSFLRNGKSTVNFEGQTTRIKMAEELVSSLKDNSSTEIKLDAMFAHVQGENDFNDDNLNLTNKSIRSKIAASADYFSANTTTSNAIKADFDNWIASQASEVFINWNTTASAGQAGQIQQAGGGSIRYINNKGLELNQAFAKGLIGALMMDQILNNYLSPKVLDKGSNLPNNDNGVLEVNQEFTAMEHKWDEAYGYLYGNETDPEVPQLDADQFLSEYLYKLEGDPDFSEIPVTIYNAFKLGRAAIVAKSYTVRDEQAEIIRENLSKIPAVRAVYYLQAGKTNLESDKATAFHALSEAYGFIYSLQFSRMPNSTIPYVTKTEVDGYLAQLMEGNGFWDVTPETLDSISASIAAEFGFTTAQAAN